MVPIPPAYVECMQREATFAARRIVRQRGLPYQDFADIRQDLLVELISRIKAFDPTRGTFRAFVDLVLRHHLARVSRKLARDRRIVGLRPISLDERLPNGERRGDTVSEASGYAAMLGQTTDAFEIIVSRLDVQRALRRLPAGQMALCHDLIDGTPTQIANASPHGRATVYRRIHDVRLNLLTAGLSAA